ncbi:MAG: S8 family serine peptidase [Chloroflexota bacterium]
MFVPVGVTLSLVVMVSLWQSNTLATAASYRVDDLARSQLQANGRADVFVKMLTDVDLSAAEGVTDRVERLNLVHDLLVAHAATSQANLLAYLDQQGVRYRSFWINNSVFVYEADGSLVSTLAERPDVAYIRGNHQVPLSQPIIVAPQANTPNGVEWNIALINADDLWEEGNEGQGIVVANNDTGVRWTHDALDEQYRGRSGNHDYAWWDPHLDYDEPYDTNGHGTHTMGIIVGDDGNDNQIGVAPGAEWIAAKGCESSSCSDFALTSAAEWLACPTRVDGSDPDCSQAPHVINNSWGGDGGDSWYRSYVRSWTAAGIWPIFSIGNSGDGCQTTTSPGDYSTVIGVGATDINDRLAAFSSKGPGAFRRLKPDVVAPGQDIRSAYNASDDSYASLSGTSMAAPHVTGVFALMLFQDPNATRRELKEALARTTVQDLLAPPGPNACGGREYDRYPNAIYGNGRVDAYAAVHSLP